VVIRRSTYAHTLLGSLMLLMVLLPTGVARAQDPGGDAPAPKPGCPFKVIRDQVQKIFGQYDDAMYNGGDIAGGEIPHVLKVEQLSIYTCLFRRRTGESLQFIANFYPDPAAAAAGFNRAGKAKNASGPYYSSQRKDGQTDIFEGPGRSLAHLNTQVILVNWLTTKGGRPAPADVPGARLTPIAQTWFSAGK
jgi:hypothetical protein